MTSTPSRRRNRVSSGTSTRVIAKARQIERRGRRRSLRPDRRHLALGAVAPEPQAHLAARAANTPSDQVRLDDGFIYPYYEHSGAPASSGRALPRSVERFDEGVLARQVVLRLTPQPLPVTPAHIRSEVGAARLVTNACSCSKATNVLLVVNQRVAQHHFGQGLRQQLMAEVPIEPFVQAATTLLLTIVSLSGRV
jgi:hypothetical protein